MNEQKFDKKYLKLIFKSFRFIEVSNTLHKKFSRVLIIMLLRRYNEISDWIFLTPTYELII